MLFAVEDARPDCQLLKVATKKKPTWRVRFRSEDRVLEVYCRKVEQGELFGFIEISGFVWGRKSEIIVDPTEQEVRNEFSGVSSALLPMHSIVRIDLVEKSGRAKVVSLGEKADEPETSDLLRGPQIPIIDPGGGKPRGRKR